ncbi:MAG: polyprenol monophosphomannose synthase [Patescibacteria group bacterium]
MKSLIIIPTLNERDNLIALIPEIFRHVPDAEILIADDHSQDGTKELARERVTVLDRITDRGYGKAVLDGFRWALKHEFKRIITMDADFSHDPAILPALISQLSTSDVAIGSRYIRGGEIQNWSLHRRMLSRVANWYVRAVLGTRIQDNTTGYMGYRRGVIEGLLVYPPLAEGYAFLVEVKYRIKNFRIAELPIVYAERREGKSKMSWKIIWESVWVPWKLRFGRK